jgi:type III pantothenate kinase
MNDFFVIALGNSSAAMALAVEGGCPRSAPLRNGDCTLPHLSGVQRVPIDRLDDLRELLAQAQTGRVGRPALPGRSPAPPRRSPVPLVAASVNPPATERLRQLAAEVAPQAPFHLAAADFPIPIRNDTAEPDRVGVDRLLAALAAYRQVRGPCIVVDFGTAITVNVVRADGALLGGAILPGLAMMAQALSKRTAQLPEVNVPDSAPAVGRTTHEAIAAGLLHGTAGAVSNLIIVAGEVVGSDAQIFLTGGDAARVAAFLPPDCRDISPDLVLEGLLIAWCERPKDGSGPRLLGPRATDPDKDRSR